MATVTVTVDIEVSLGAAPTFEDSIVNVPTMNFTLDIPGDDPRVAAFRFLAELSRAAERTDSGAATFQGALGAALKDTASDVSPN